MMEERQNSVPELWHPYSRSGEIHVDQSPEGIKDYLTDSSNPSRFDRITFGL